MQFQHSEPGLSAEPEPQQYAFGDGDLAARRLALLHEVYALSSSALLADAVTRTPVLAYDLGCGLGGWRPPGIARAVQRIGSRQPQIRPR
jgi:hypothetical protein